MTCWSRDCSGSFGLALCGPGGEYQGLPAGIGFSCARQMAGLEARVVHAATDFPGFCVFGRSLTVPNIDFMTRALNDALGTELESPFFQGRGREKEIYQIGSSVMIYYEPGNGCL